jgi:hypothetical protein
LTSGTWGGDIIEVFSSMKRRKSGSGLDVILYQCFALPHYP